MALSSPLSFFVGLGVATTAFATQQFVPACIAEQCLPEFTALIGDDYTRGAVNCTIANFGPCAGKAWECLGDASCKSVLTCAPQVFNTCKADLWTMLTHPDEREKIMCMAECYQDGKIQPFCVASKCGKAVLTCLADKTCRDAALCLPKAQLACSKPAFNCVFGKDKVCRENLQCLGHGVSQCGASAVNLLTDSKIADVIACAGSKCPHPSTGAETMQFPAKVTGDEPSNVASQMLCLAGKCSSKVLKVFTDQDTKDLLKCALKGDLVHTCSAVWSCLGDSKCSEALSCWAKPFDSCKGDIWRAFTVENERKRIETGAQCLRNCHGQHKDDFTQAAFCVLDNCSQGLLDCYNDATCRDAVKCLPDTAGQCVIPQLDAYLHQELFKNSTKCVALGLESCGRGAIEMLRDQNIAEAVQCASQCTRKPPSSTTPTIQVVV